MTSDDASCTARPRLGVLFSGGGRTLENLARRIVEGSIEAEISLAISSHAAAGGIERARPYGIPVEVVDWREHPRDLSERILDRLDAARVDWILLAGFIRYFEFPDRLVGRVVNIHPSLLPKFGGKGYFGMRVHRAVLEARERVSGCTVHFVHGEYDRGPILLQRVVPVHPNDTPETLAERVFVEECEAYPEAISLLTSGRARLEDGRVILDGVPRPASRPDGPGASAPSVT